MTRVLIVDDHPAVRAGLVGLVRREPGFTAVAACGTAAEGLAEAARWLPDVALVDYELPDGDGVLLTYELAQLPAPPFVAIYSAFAEPQLSLAAAVAGAHAVIDKSLPVEAVFELLRAVARGEALVDRANPEVLRTAATVLAAADHPVVGLALAGEPIDEIARVLDRREDEVALQLQRIIERLKPVRPEPSTSLSYEEGEPGRPPL